MKKKAKPTNKASVKKSEPKTEEREVIHPKFRQSSHIGDRALTADQAKILLGWEVETVDEPFGEEYLVKNSKGKKIRCRNNLKNRFFKKEICATYRQEILRGNWNLQSETIGIGQTGLITDGQHRLVGLVLANESWENEPDRYLFWTSSPTIEVPIIFGLSEDESILLTQDTGVSRTFSDVLFIQGYFPEIDSATRRDKACKKLDYAVRFVWRRLGVSDALEITGGGKFKRTHAETVAFLENHRRLEKATQFLLEEEANQKKVSSLLPLGTAAGLLYLMGSATTEPRLYHQADNPCEDLLDWELWDKACDFWALLAGDSEEFQLLRNFLGKVIEDGDSTVTAKTAVLVRGWSAFLSGKMAGVGNRKLKYETSEDGVRILAECPTVGGIDLGDGEWEHEPTPQDPTPDEIASRATTQRIKRSTKKKKETSKKKKSAKKKKGSLPFRHGQTGWLTKPSGESRKVKIIKLVRKIAIVQTEQGFLGAGATEKIDVGRLTRTQPNHRQPHEVPDEKED